MTNRLPEGIPVVLLTGYLGSGKTSLINALIADSELRDTAVVVNEFGEIAVDYDLIQIEIATASGHKHRLSLLHGGFGRQGLVVRTL